jgi:tRNA threonylcarbamoyladenosine biosynthesis protein TsaB
VGWPSLEGVILGIDTSVGTSVAVVAPDGVVLGEAAISDTMRHAEVIGTLIRDALAQASAGTADITAVAAGMGPGPFTGLRVGIAAARAFALGASGVSGAFAPTTAQGRGVPVVPVVSHDAVALSLLLAPVLRDGEPPRDAVLRDEESPRFAVVTDARRRELAYTVYDGLDDDGLPVRIAEPALAPRDELDARLDALGARRHDAASVPAAMLALAASRAVAVGREIGPRDALYLRSPDVTLSAGPKRTGQKRVSA